MGALNTIITGLQVERSLPPSKLTRRHVQRSGVNKSK
jgi:hypothetical protein